MIYEDTVSGNFREFLIELVSGKFRKITYFGSVPLSLAAFIMQASGH